MDKRDYRELQSEDRFPLSLAVISVILVVALVTFFFLVLKNPGFLDIWR